MEKNLKTQLQEKEDNYVQLRQVLQKKLESVKNVKFL